VEADVIILGAGAAGLMCAIEAGKRGKRVAVLDHAANPAEKIRISGGGRCNFTNIHTRPSHFISENPAFCVSALSRYTPQHFIALVQKHGIAFHEKTLGQLFCDDSSRQVIDMLLAECAEANVVIHLETSIRSITKTAGGFLVSASNGEWRCTSLVVATGGLSIPKMGATGIGYEIARQFGIPVIAPSPALVPFTLAEDILQHTKALSGIAVDTEMRCGKTAFREGMLFTHRGISGPAALQISSYWARGEAISTQLLPDIDLTAALLNAKRENPRQELLTALCQHFPKRLAQAFLQWHAPDEAARRLADFGDKRLAQVAQWFQAWQLRPQGTEGYRTAEVTRGGVDTAALSSKTMECKTVPGLYFIGEVVDVTGHLGGFNFQWAWASGFAAGQYAGN
jgi:predicted Rossmann fold flavoprotein